MKAVWVTQVYPRCADDPLGGFLHRLARELPARGVEVEVVAPGSQGAPAEVLRPELLRAAFGIDADILEGPDGLPVIVPSLRPAPESRGSHGAG